MRIQVAFDYRCGYSYKAARWLKELRAAGHGPDIEWVPFSLEQVNEEFGEGVLLWEHPEFETGSFLALAAGRWVREHSPEAFEEFHYAVFSAKHDEGKALDHRRLLKIAKKAGADASSLEKGLDSGEAAFLAGMDFLHLKNERGVFGTPTILTPDGDGVYVRLRGVWQDEAHRARVWDLIERFSVESIVGEAKRVVPPAPAAPVALAPPS